MKEKHVGNKKRIPLYYMCSRLSSRGRSQRRYFITIINKAISIYFLDTQFFMGNKNTLHKVNIVNTDIVNFITQTLSIGYHRS